MNFNPAPRGLPIAVAPSRLDDRRTPRRRGHEHGTCLDRLLPRSRDRDTDRGADLAAGIGECDHTCAGIGYVLEVEADVGWLRSGIENETGCDLVRGAAGGSVIVCR